jgi:hypothetical protein
MPLGISYCEITTKAESVLRLDIFEDDADAYCGVVKQFASFDSHNSSALYPRETAFSLGKGHCAREIQFNNVPGSQRRSCRNSNQHAAAAYVTASAVKKAVCLW